MASRHTPQWFISCEKPNSLSIGRQLTLIIIIVSLLSSCQEQPFDPDLHSVAAVAPLEKPVFFQKQPRMKEYDLSTPISSNELCKGQVIHGKHPLPYGSPERRFRYEWRLYAGHDVQRLQVHFRGLKIEQANTQLQILDGDGGQLAAYDASSGVVDWSPLFNTNTLRISFAETSPLASPKDSFTIDRIRVWSHLQWWFENHPSGNVVVDGAKPNVQVLQWFTEAPWTQEQSWKLNQEIRGVIPSGGDHFFLVNDYGISSFDFAVVSDTQSGPPPKFESDRDLRYSEKFLHYIVGYFGRFTSGDDDLQDLAIVSSLGEVYLAIQQSQGFAGFHIAHRNLGVDLGTVSAGRMNNDHYDDLIGVNGTTVFYSLSIQNQHFPQFDDVQSISLPINSANFPPKTNIVPLIADFNSDGYVDVAIVIEEDEATGGLQDHIRMFHNDQAGAFETHAIWPISGLTNRIRYQRQFRVGDFDGDGDIDILAEDRPDPPHDWDPASYYDGKDVFHYVARNHNLPFDRPIYDPLSPSPLAAPFTAFTLWSQYQIRADDGRNHPPNALLAADVNGDERSDLVTTRGYAADLRLFVTLATENLGFGGTNDWGSAAMLGSNIVAFENTQGNSRLISADNTSPLRGLVAHNPYNPIHRINLLSTSAIIDFDDVNGDRRADAVIFTGDEAGTVEVLLAQADNTFERSSHAWMESFGKLFAQDQDPVLLGTIDDAPHYDGREVPRLGDVDGDGLTDLVLFAFDRPAFPPPGEINSPTQGVFVALNQGDESFGPLERWHTSLVTSASPWAGQPCVLVADFDGDGRSDAAVADVRFGVWVKVWIVLSQGNIFGPSLTDVDKVPIFGYGNTNMEIQARDIDGDRRADIVVQQRGLIPSTQSTVKVYVYLATPSGYNARELMLEYRVDGTVWRPNWLQFGQFIKDRFADASLLLPPPPSVTDFKKRYRLRTWLSDYVSEDFVDVGEAFTGIPYYQYASHCVVLDTADIDTDSRDEMLLVMPRKKALDIVAVDFACADLDLHATPLWSSGSFPPSSIPNIFGGPSTVRAETPYKSNEIIWDRRTAEGDWILRVRNKGGDPADYKLISNNVVRRGKLDVLFLIEPEDIDLETINHYKDKLRAFTPRLYDAVDGRMYIRDYNLWKVTPYGDVKWWRDNKCREWMDVYLCGDDLELCRKNYSDVPVEDQARAHARYNCHMTLYQGNGPGTYVHEYGHYGFAMDDEYCENDNPSPPHCVTGDSNFRAPICPFSLMASGLLGREFCTELNHQIPNFFIWLYPRLKSPQWSHVPSISFDFTEPVLEQQFGPAVPIYTPHPHRYEEEMFQEYVRIREIPQ